jgi:hydroxymethylbilane synthase
VGRREDVRDALISRGRLTLDALPRGARVGTSSLRRQAQLRNRRPDLQMADVRGNVDTRLAKVERGEYDAVLLAKAGLDRLGLSNAISEVLPPDVCLPAAGQGAIGIEMRAPANDLDREIAIAVGQLNHGSTRLAVETERAVLAGLSGGCDLPLGVWAREEAGQLVVDACVLSVDGAEAVRAGRAGPAGESASMAHAVTAELRSKGADRLIELGGRRLGAP